MTSIEVEDLSRHIEKSIRDDIAQLPKLEKTIHEENNKVYPVVYIGKKCINDDLDKCSREIAVHVEYLCKNNHVKAFLGSAMHGVPLMDDKYMVVSYMAVDDDGNKYIKDNNLSFELGEL